MTLTPREIEVVQIVAGGRTDKEAAQALGISPLTVRNHLRNVRDKTGLTNRTELALFAIRVGLISVEQRIAC